jgi:hypothetical protein
MIVSDLGKPFPKTIIENSKKAELTLKGETKQSGTDIPKRIEITCKWSDTGLKEILKELNQMLKTESLNISALKFDEDLAQQEVVMKSLGFKMVQKRSCDRIRKVVKVRKGRLMKLFAEIDFDSVSVEFDKEKVKYYNVEVEFKTLNKKETSRDAECKSMDKYEIDCKELEEMEEFREHIKEVTQRMILHFCPILVRWKHSKFATFKALRAVYDETLTNTDRSLKKDSFWKIDHFIRNIH